MIKKSFLNLMYIMYIMSISVFIISAIPNFKASASTIAEKYANSATKNVYVTKTMKVYKIVPGDNEADNHWSSYGYVHKGEELWVSDWIMSTGGGYIIYYGDNSSKTNSHYFYFVKDLNKSKWFEPASNYFKYKLKKTNEHINNQIHHFFITHKMIKVHYKTTQSQKLLKQTGVYYDSKYSLFYSNYAPTSKKAVVPDNFKLVDGVQWILPNGDIYAYIDNHNAKKIGFKHAGWVNDTNPNDPYGAIKILLVK